MDLLDRVRDVAADATPLTETQFNAARQRLLREIARAERVPAGSRRRWLGAGGLVAASAAAAVVIGVVGNTSGVAPAAAQVLEHAAETTLTTVVLDPAPGQYIRIDERYEQKFRGFAPEDGVELDIDYTVGYSRAWYVPADRSGDWVADFSVPDTVIITRGDTSLAGEIAARELVQPQTAIAGVAAIEAYPGGRIMGGDAWQEHDYRVNSLERYYDEMPSDPQALLAWIDGYQPQEGVSAPELVNLFGFNLAPPEVRATIFRALALKPGVSVLSVDGDITTIAYLEGGESDARAVIEVDTAQGLIVGFGPGATDERGVTTRGDSFGRITTTIVDAAPAATRIAG